jgi:hypothetical protein
MYIGWPPTGRLRGVAIGTHTHQGVWRQQHPARIVHRAAGKVMQRVLLLFVFKQQNLGHQQGWEGCCSFWTTCPVRTAAGGGAPFLCVPPHLHPPTLNCPAAAA